jgi:hypothetical protein
MRCIGKRPARRLVIAGALLAMVAAGCQSSGKPKAAPTSSSVDLSACLAWNENSTSGSSYTSTTVTSATRDAYLADHCLRLNQIQVIGSHNSYHVQPEPVIFNALKGFNKATADSLEYSHPALAEQFDHEGVRQIELDVYADPQGGRYVTNHLLTFLGQPGTMTDPAWKKPGFKVFHEPEVDFQSSCGITFVTCLQKVKQWSDAHPHHLPITILVELKDTPVSDPLHLNFTQPLHIGTAEENALDGEIRSVFPMRDVITPDDVRGSASTLEDAVLHNGWPTLAASRGKVMFLMDNSDQHRTDYLVDHPSLRGRILFTNAKPGEDDAAFVEHNDALGAENVAQIQDLVRKGYVVRTRSDADTVEARKNDTATRDDAIKSGAQWVSTDYPIPGIAKAKFGTDYVAQIPGGDPARCNPIITDPACQNAALEQLP